MRERACWADLVQQGRNAAQHARVEASAHEAFRAALAETGLDPVALAGQFRTDLPAVIRRIATLPEGIGGAETGPGTSTAPYPKPAARGRSADLAVNITDLLATVRRQ